MSPKGRNASRDGFVNISQWPCFFGNPSALSTCFVVSLFAYNTLSNDRNHLEPAMYIYIFNLRTDAVSAFVPSLEEHRSFWHAPSTDRLICAGKTVSFVVGFLHTASQSAQTAQAVSNAYLQRDTMLPGRVLNLHCTEVQCRERNIYIYI